MGTCNANVTVLWRSLQLILVAENGHFEGSTHLKVKEGSNARLGERVLTSILPVCRNASPWISARIHPANHIWVDSRNSLTGSVDVDLKRTSMYTFSEN